MAQGDERLDGLEGDAQAGGVAERAVGVGEPVEEVCVLALGAGRDDLARAGEDVHLQDRLVGQAAAERRRLDAEAGHRTAQGDGLELGHHQRRQSVGQGRLHEVLVGAHPLDVRGARLRVDRDHAPQPGHVQARCVGGGSGTEQVGRLLGEPDRRVRRDGAIARGEPAHRKVMAGMGSGVDPHRLPLPGVDDVRHDSTLCRCADSRHAGWRKVFPRWPGRPAVRTLSRHGPRPRPRRRPALPRLGAPRHTRRGSCSAHR